MAKKSITSKVYTVSDKTKKVYIPMDINLTAKEQAEIEFYVSHGYGVAPKKKANERIKAESEKNKDNITDLQILDYLLTNGEIDYYFTYQDNKDRNGFISARKAFREEFGREIELSDIKKVERDTQHGETAKAYKVRVEEQRQEIVNKILALNH